MGTKRWSPSSTDATSFAAFRWYANTIESTAIDAYVTDREVYAYIEDVLRRAVTELRAAPIRDILSDDDCPDGYVRCGIWCKPACFSDNLAASASVSVSADSARKASAVKKGAKRR